MSHQEDDEDSGDPRFDLDQLIDSLPSGKEILSSAFIARRSGPAYWVVLANAYLVGAGILFREAQKGAYEFITKVDLDAPHQTIRLLAYKDLFLPAKFLLAQACELLLKGICLARGAKARELVTHNLIELAQRGNLHVSAYELDLLKLMEREITWAARYPAPNAERDYCVHSVDLGFDDTRRYKILGTRLYRRLYRVFIAGSNI